MPGPDGAALRDYLSQHGVDAKELTVPSNGRKPGIAILEESDKLGCDLLFKGAYTQSRIRQMILDRRPAAEVKQAAREEGMTFLRDSALEKVFAGETTLTEINKVTFIQ